MFCRLRFNSPRAWAGTGAVYTQRIAEERRLREEARQRQLEDELLRWRKAKDLRAYVEAILAVAGDAGCVFHPRSDAWLAWLSEEADRIDPLSPIRASVAALVAERVGGRALMQPPTCGAIRGACAASASRLSERGA